MRLVFWQCCLSPHQIPYISYLEKDNRVDEVILVSPEAKELTEMRQQMGWTNLQSESFPFKVVVNPSSEDVEAILNFNQSESWHLFNGLRGFDFVFDAFKRSLKYKLKRGLITERPNTYYKGLPNGKPLLLHRLRYFLQDRKYIKEINCVFAMGQSASDFFSLLSNKIQSFPFAYCTKTYETHTLELKDEIRFCFIGNLCVRKSVITLLKACNLLPTYYDYKLSIVGDGQLRKQLQCYVTDNNLNKVEFLGTKQNSEIPQFLSGIDVLILPSIYDGWGAVINEALHTGVYVICSDTCGAKDLLINKQIGNVFKNRNSRQLAKCMQQCIDNIEEIRKLRDTRKQWADSHISGEHLAKYMVDCLCGEKVLPPWKEFDKNEMIFTN